MHHRLRGPALAVLAGALLATAGCSEGSPAASPSGSPAPASATPSPSAATVSAPPSTPAASAPAPTVAGPSYDCVDTGAMAPEKLAAYLVRLKSSSGSYGSKALKIDGDGLKFEPDPSERPCGAVELTLSRYWVDLTPGGVSSGVPGWSRDQEFRYTLMDRPALSLGPQDGIVEGSVPPGSLSCRGSLSVVHVGPEIAEGDLPYDLQMPTSFSAAGRGAMDVTVKSDRALAATFVPPSAPQGC
ncbi:hypothetical protein ACLF6K_02455 [Streptomyces xanthophaeus]|uniref:hypothetical protein n=1 Tax=Streptomyces xanthophaeus TaxID=67385 RepID=UPI00398FABC3